MKFNFWWRRIDAELRFLIVYLFVLGVIFFFAVDKFAGIGMGIFFLFVLSLSFHQLLKKG